MMGAWAWQARVACCFSSEGGIGLRDGPFDWHPGLGKHQNCLPQNTKPSSLTNLPVQICWSGNGCRRDILGVAGWADEGCLRLTRHLGRQNPGQEWRCIFGSHQATAHPRATASLQPCQSLTAKNLPGYSTESFFEENHCDQIR